MKRLLYIEDNLMEIEAFRRYLKKNKIPYEFEISTSIKDAKKKLKQGKIDVILTDSILPDGSGLDLLKFSLRLPIILLIDKGEEELALRAMKQGVMHYLVKDGRKSHLRFLQTLIDSILETFEIKRQVKLLSQALRNIHEGVIITDKEERIHYVNPAFTKIYGYKSKEVIGKHKRDLWKEKSYEDNFFVNKQQSLIDEYYHVRKGGDMFPVSLSSSILSVTGDDLFYVDIVRDITKRKRLEAKLIEQSEKIGKSKAEFENLRVMTFLTAHDLKEPLVKILIFCNALKAQHEFSEEELKKIDKIHRAALKMKDLLNEIRNIMQVMIPPATYEPLELDAVLQEVLLSFNEQLEQCGAYVEVDSLPVIIGDKKLIKQLFSNLIDNALKFRKQEEVCRIQIWSEESIDFYQIHFKDNGIGIPREFHEKIFHPFNRVFESRDQFGSNLAKCRKIMLRHNGDISVESNPNQGTLFILTFPKSKDEV